MQPFIALCTIAFAVTCVLLSVAACILAGRCDDD